MSESSYSRGWIPEDDFRRLDLGEDVSYRSVMRKSDGRVWCAPLGTPDPWPEDEAGEWMDL